MELRSVFLVGIFIFQIITATSESGNSESLNYYNGTSFPPPYDVTSRVTEGYENGNASLFESTPDPFNPKGLVDDSEEENLQNQATTTAASALTNSPETVPSPTTRPSVSTTPRPKPVTPTIPTNSTLPPSPGFSTQSSEDNLGNKGNGQGGGSYGGASSNPSPAGPVPGSPINDGIPGPGAPGSAADGMPAADGPSTCLCAAICLTQTPGPQAPPGNGPCVSLCACVGASTQSGTPGSGVGSKDVPGGPAPPSPPLADLPAASAGTDTAQSAVQDGTAVAASQAPPPPTPPQSQNS